MDDETATIMMNSKFENPLDYAWLIFISFANFFVFNNIWRACEKILSILSKNWKWVDKIANAFCIKERKKSYTLEEFKAISNKNKWENAPNDYKYSLKELSEIIRFFESFGKFRSEFTVSDNSMPIEPPVGDGVSLSDTEDDDDNSLEGDNRLK